MRASLLLVLTILILSMFLESQCRKQPKNKKIQKNGQRKPLNWWNQKKPTTKRPKPKTTTKRLAVPDHRNISNKTRQQLRRILGGVTPEARRKRLQNIRKNSHPLKLSRNQSDQLQKKVPKAKVYPPPVQEAYEINQQIGLGDYLVDGDIFLEESQMDWYEMRISSQRFNSSRVKRQMLTCCNLWPGNNVNYYFDASLNQRKIDSVNRAIAMISSSTCVTFTLSSTAKNRLKIMKDSGCWSYYGMSGKEQELSLDDGCEATYFPLRHLIAALDGSNNIFRYDRDDYVTIDLTDVPAASQANLAPFLKSDMEILIPYEYGSLMSTVANIYVPAGGRLSNVPKDPQQIYTIGGRLLTYYDLYLINQMYSCKCKKGTPPACTNGGYQNPADCTKCNCPNGYGGDLCNQMPSVGCGQMLVATPYWQSVTYTMGNPASNTSRDFHDMCYHWITAPAGQTIQFRIDSADNPYCAYGCVSNGIEPKVYTNQLLNSPRYCCSEFFNQVLSTTVNPLPVITYSSFGATTWTWSYRYDGPTTTNPSSTSTSTITTTTTIPTTTITTPTTTTPTTTTTEPTTTTTTPTTTTTTTPTTTTTTTPTTTTTTTPTTTTMTSTTTTTTTTPTTTTPTTTTADPTTTTTTPTTTTTTTTTPTTTSTTTPTTMTTTTPTTTTMASTTITTTATTTTTAPTTTTTTPTTTTETTQTTTPTTTTEPTTTTTRPTTTTTAPTTTSITTTASTTTTTTPATTTTEPKTTTTTSTTTTSRTTTTTPSTTPTIPKTIPTTTTPKSTSTTTIPATTKTTTTTVSACKDLKPVSNCAALASCSTLPSVPKNEQKLNCAKTLGLCGKPSMSPCADFYSSCSSYKSAGRCTSDWPLVAEYNCAKTCGFCSTPV